MDCDSRTDVKALYDSARNTLLYKQDNGGGHVAWSAAWEACLWARLGEAERVWGALVRINNLHVTPRLLTLHIPTVKETLKGAAKRRTIECQTCYSGARTTPEGRNAPFPLEREMLTADKSAVRCDTSTLNYILSF